MRRKRYAVSIFQILLIVFVMASAVWADSSAESASSQTESVVSAASTVSEQSAAPKSADEENNDGDDVYVSNNGTRFRIPRVTPVSGVYDYAGLFESDEIEDMNERIRKLAEKKNVDIVILTSYDVPKDLHYSTETSMRYARQFLVDSGFKDDSFIAIIDMNNRVFWAAGYGKYGDKKYTGWGDKVFAKAKSELSDADYFDAMIIYINEVNRLGNLVMAAIPTPMSLLISLGLAILVLIIFLTKHKATQPSVRNTPAPDIREYKRIAHDKSFLGTTVHRRHIPRNHGGGGGGGGFGGGGFSSGSGGSSSGGGGHF